MVRFVDESNHIAPESILHQFLMSCTENNKERGMEKRELFHQFKA
jgi:hypothetical protein